MNREIKIFFIILLLSSLFFPIFKLLPQKIKKKKNLSHFIEIDKKLSLKDVSGNLYFYLDTSTKKSFENILTEKSTIFHRYSQKPVYFSQGKHIIWAYLPVNVLQEKKLYLFIDYFLISKISVFTYQKNGKYLEIKGGRNLFASTKLKQNKIDSRFTVLPLKLIKGKQKIFIKIDSQKDIVRMKTYILDSLSLGNFALKKSFFYGLFVSLVTVFAVLGFMIFIISRLRAFLFYSLFLISYSILIFTVTGMLGLLYEPFLNLSINSMQQLANIGGHLSLVTYSIFTIYFLNLKDSSPKMTRLSYIFIGTAFLNMFFNISRSPISQIIFYFHSIGLSLFFLIYSIRMIRKNQFAIYYTITGLFSGVLFILMGLNINHVIELDIWHPQSVTGKMIEMTILCFALGLQFRNFVKEKQEKLKSLNFAYERFVPKQFLNLLGKKNIIDVKLGDQTLKEMNILFTDIRSFTTLSEGMTPKENFDFINDFLSRIAPAMKINNGFIDKYIGDAIMALFPNQAEDALKAAIEISNILNKYNKQRIKTKQQEIQVGIGIHTGNLILGTIGSESRMDGTVISDAVNLASRMEGLTKKYGATLLISDKTFSQIPDPTIYNFRLLDIVKVKGKNNSVSVFEIIDADLQNQKKIKIETKNDFEYGLFYYFNEDFNKAKDYFQAVLDKSPIDKAAILYLQRCLKYEKHSPPEDWDRIAIIDTK